MELRLWVAENQENGDKASECSGQPKERPPAMMTSDRAGHNWPKKGTENFGDLFTYRAGRLPVTASPRLHRMTGSFEQVGTS